MAALPACWPRKTSRKLRSEPLGASESLLRSHWGLETAPRALQEASRQPQERSGRLQDGPKSVPGDSRQPQELSRRLQDVFKSTPEGSRRPKSALGGFKTTQPLRSCSRWLIKSTWALLAVFESAQRHPKWAFRNAFEETVRFRSAQMCKLLVS